jgi:DNA-binding CsgD family transcriptional regulator
MEEAEQTLSLVGDIYDAALDPALWPDVLHKITGFVGGASSALHSHDFAAQRGRFYFSWGDDPHYTKLYFEKYIRICPTAGPLVLLKVGDVCSSSTFMPTDQFRATRFYKEWAKPAGYGDNTITLLEKSATIATYLFTPHADDESPADDEARRRMALIGPHVRRAVAIGGIIDMHKVEAEVLAEAVDALSAGVFLVGEDATLVGANASGRAMLEAGEIPRLADRGIAPVQLPALRETLARAGQDAVSPGATAVPLTSRGGERYVAHVLPLTSGTRRQARLSYGAVAAVFVHKAALEGVFPLEAIAQQFKLSAAEVRVLMITIELGGSVPDMAPVLGVSEPTVRTHLRRLFEKTGAKRQADLVKLVAGYTNPLIRQDERSS